MVHSSNKPRGFTITELLVSIAIIGVISGAMLANFHGGQQSAEIRLASEIMVSQLRDIQTASLGGRLVSACSGGTQANQVCEPGKQPAIACNGGGTCQRRSVPGYGIHLVANQTTYTVFYDVNGNNTYDTGEDVVSKSFTPTGVVKLGAANAVLPLDIVFNTPDATVKFNNAAAPDLLTLTLTHVTVGSIRHVNVFRIAGRIEHD